MAWTQWEEETPGVELKEMIYQKKYREKGGAVARILFNRTHKMNALTNIGWNEIVNCMMHANLDKDVAVIIISSVGEHFGVGGDMEWEAEGGLADLAFMPRFDEAVKNSMRPVIAAVKGYCIGGHNHLAYHCDFTIAADSAIFGQNGPRVASPIHGHLVSSLAYVVGLKRAKEIWMLCRKYTPQEALQMGLINTVVPLSKLEDEVDQWCDEIMDLVPDSISMIKQSFEAVDTYVKFTDGSIMQMISPDFFMKPATAEAHQAFFEKRKPEFWKHAKKESK